jgi:hypothetical protein
MPKFTFPLNREGLRRILSTPEAQQVLRPFNAPDNVEYAISCMTTGYTNKMTHKEKQMEDKYLREMLKADPRLKQDLQRRVKEQTATPEKPAEQGRLVQKKVG